MPAHPAVDTMSADAVATGAGRSTGGDHRVADRAGSGPLTVSPRATGNSSTWIHEGPAPAGNGSDAMSAPFKGTINVDIRDSVPDWSPFAAAQGARWRPERRLHRARRRGLLGDELVRRADRHAQHRPHRGRGRALHAVAHDRALLADALLPADGAQPHAQQHGLHHRGGRRLSQRERHHPARERHAARDPRASWAGTPTWSASGTSARPWR